MLKSKLLPEEQTNQSATQQKFIWAYKCVVDQAYIFHVFFHHHHAYIRLAHFSFQLADIHEIFSGEDESCRTRKKALINAIVALCPENGSFTGAVRVILFQLAPPYLWQYFSGQGMTGSTKKSFADAIPSVYKTIITAMVQSRGCAPKTVMTAISDVLKACFNRKESVDFRKKVVLLGTQMILKMTQTRTQMILLK